MNVSSLFVRNAALAIALIGCVAAMPASAAGNAAKEVATAAEHAGYAAKADSAKGTHVHMHHVLNCLVGPKGQGFDAAPGNPCKGMGNGAINDAGNSSASKTDLGNAVKLDRIGLKVDDPKAAADIASAIEQILKQAHKNM